ncbi:putative DNA-binding protein ESCAROLA [Acorus calamus]|uniref:DNA-binding protein ESCAROLA n=1 Tax=Acorus calamus TaxID=4465 RepID=A0AAV9EMI9_ACOCL|nr:putative DNA-binding protein ESCAROLA [Acorus calamus]
MRSEYEERRGPSPIFTNLHHHHHPHYQTSDEVDSSSAPQQPPPPPPPTKPNNKRHSPTPSSSAAPHGGDGATIEVVRRPRGRPPGSKNRPKPPVVVTRDPDPPSVLPHVLEVPAGADVADSLHRFSLRRAIGLSVLSASGPVSNVTLRSGGSGGGPAGVVTFHGRFEILSITATFFPPSFNLPPAASAASLSVALSGPQGQVVGGTVAGPLIAAGTVVVVAAAFGSPSYHRLPAEEEAASASASDPEAVAAADSDHRNHDGRGPPPPHGAAAVSASCGMSMYGGLFPSDVVWAPTPRPPPPHHHY